MAGVSTPRQTRSAGPHAGVNGGRKERVKTRRLRRCRFRAGPGGKLQESLDHRTQQSWRVCWSQDLGAQPTCGEGPVSMTAVLQQSAATSLQGKLLCQRG